MREVWILLLKPVRLTIEGGYEDLAEVEEDSHVKISRASSKPEVEEDLHVSSEPEVEEEAPANVVIDRDLGILPGTIADWHYMRGAAWDQGFLHMRAFLRI